MNNNNLQSREMDSLINRILNDRALPEKDIRALVGIDADTVKESQEIRHSVKAKVDAILDMF